MVMQDKAVEKFLIPEQYYLWGDILVLAWKDDGGEWALTCTDQKTGHPVQPAVGVVTGYILMDNQWREMVYANSDGSRTRAGNIVKIDLSQFRDIISTRPIELIDGAVYSNGRQSFIAYKQGEDDLFDAWMLLRIIRVKNDFVTPNALGDLQSYTLGRDGYWRESRILTDKSVASGFCPEFEVEILPTLEHIADNIDAFLYSH